MLRVERTAEKASQGSPHLQVCIIFIRQWHVGGSFHLLLVVLENGLVDLDFWWSKSRCCDKFKRLVADKFPSKPQKRLFEVIIRLGRDIIVLKILLAVEGDGLGLDLALLDINLVAGQDNWNILADTDEITVPVRHVLVGDTGGHVEHDDTALAVDVVSIAKATKLLLTSSIPHIELDLTQVRCEAERVDFHTEGCNVLLLKLACDVTLDECSLACTTVADKDELECRNPRSSLCHDVGCLGVVEYVGGCEEEVF